MTDRTRQLRALIGSVIAMDREWMSRHEGYDDPGRCLPWMPFSWPDFIALIGEALPETTGDKFLDVGAGIGTKMLLAREIFGLDVTGIERVPAYIKVARDHDLMVIERDAAGWDGYGDYDLVYFNRPFFDQGLQERLEQHIWNTMKPGAVVVGVNLVASPPPTWYPILDDREVRRWILQKPLDTWRCDHCGRELQTGMPDGRQFRWVHADRGAEYCALVSGYSDEPVAVATWNGTKGLRYA